MRAFFERGGMVAKKKRQATKECEEGEGEEKKNEQGEVNFDMIGT
jgi:hypothetical protein